MCRDRRRAAHLRSRRSEPGRRCRRGDRPDDRRAARGSRRDRDPVLRRARSLGGARRRDHTERRRSLQTSRRRPRRRACMHVHAAQVAYRHAGSELAAVVDGGDVLDAARRAHLIDQVNERDQATFAHLRDVSQDLREQRRSLEATRVAQAETVHELTEQGAAMDAKLAEASRREAAEREAAQRAAAQRAAAAAPATSPVAPAAAPAPAAPAARRPRRLLPPRRRHPRSSRRHRPHRATRARPVRTPTTTIRSSSACADARVVETTAR